MDATTQAKAAFILLPLPEALSKERRDSLIMISQSGNFGKEIYIFFVHVNFNLETCHFLNPIETKLVIMILGIRLQIMIVKAFSTCFMKRVLCVVVVYHIWWFASSQAKIGSNMTF